MAKGAKRKQYFILGLLGAMALVVTFLMLRDIPAPQTQQVIELDAANVLQKK
ncbi:MAG: hypothetical protein MK052_09715 [Alphaproteobacteria bacterium]|nr:hypothetical protein [Alphaproteobacteria bacterium]